MAHDNLNNRDECPLRSTEDIEAIRKYFRFRIDTASNTEDKNISGKYLILFTLSINIGMRLPDILLLTWGDILTDKRIVKDYIIQKAKNDEDKNYELIPICKSTIYEYIIEFEIDTSFEKHLFPSRQGSGVLGLSAVCTMFNKIMDECGCDKNFGVYSLQKTYIYHRIRNIVSKNETIIQLNELQKLVGSRMFINTLKYFE